MDWDKVKQQRRAEAKVKMPDTSNSNPKITDDDVNGFLNSIDSATKDVEKYLTEPTYSTRDERSGYRSTIRNQRNKANEIALYVAQNRNKYSNSDEILNYLDNYIESLRGLATDVSKYGDFYSSNFKSEDDYNNYLDSIKKQEELLNFDTAAANKELSDLEAARNNIEYDVAYDTARSSRFGVSARKNIGVDQTERENLDRRISELKQKITLASRAQNAEKLRSNALNDIEFKKYSDQGASIKNPSMRDAEGFMTVFGKPIGGEDIGNIVTYSRDNWKEIAMGGANGGTVQGNAIYKYMTGEEVDIYNYYLAKEGAEKASEYLDSITENLNMRQASGIYDELEDKTALQYVFGVSAGLDQFGSGVRNTVKAIKGDDSYTPASSTQIASGMIREGLADDGAKLPEWMGGGSVGQLGYDAITNTTNNLPSMLVGSIFGPGAGTITMGASVYGNAYSEMINLGYDKNQANSYAALTAASEAGLQYLLGGISSLGGKVSNNVLKRIISNVDNAFAKIAIQYGGEMMSEFTEEYLQDVLDPYFKNLATGENNEVTLLSPDAMYSGILGALNAGASNATFGAINSVANNSYLNKYYKDTYGDIDTVKSLIEEGLSTEKDSKSYSLAEKMKAKTEDGGNVSGAALRKLVEANEKQFSNTDTAKIEAAAEERLKSLGETSDTAKIAKALTKQVKGEVLSISEQKALDNSKYGQRVANELSPENIRSGSYSSSWAENIGTDRINADLYNLARETAGAKETTATGKKSLQVEQSAPQTKQESARAKVQTSETTSLPKAKNAVQGKFEVSDNGETFSLETGEDIKIADIASIKNGKMTFKLENGEEIVADKVSFGNNGEALIYETVANLPNMNTASANLLIKNTDLGTAPADVYARGIEEAYRYGTHSIPAQEMMENGAFAADLTEQQRMQAYRLGQSNHKAATQVKESTVRKNRTIADKKEAVAGKVHYDKTRAYNDRQKASIEAIEKIADALGVEFYLFESKVVNGKRQGANGWYDPKDGSIHIDIYAGQNGESTMLFTAAHELTHFIKEWSPAKFDILADFLMEEYGKKGVSVNALVRAQQKKARRNGRKISYDVAFEEVVADSMETMLADGNVMEKLAKLKAKDKTLWEKIKSFIDELVNKIREVYSGLTPDSVEGRYVADMKDSIEKIQQLFTEGLIEAAENFQTIGSIDLENFADAKNTDGEQLFQYRAMETDEETYKSMLKKWGKFSDAQINNLFTTIDKAMDIIKDNLEILDYAWEADVNDRAFSPVKPNSDSLYKVSIDFSTLCRKRLLQQTVQAQLQEALNRPMTREEGIAIRDALMAIQEEGRQIEIACALCYVESARMKSPAQIKKFLENREAVLKDFFASKSGGDTKAKIKKAELEARERLGVGDAFLKSLPDEVAEEIRAAKREAKASYKPTAEEQKLIDAAMKMTVSDFTTPAGLENLAKNYRGIFDGYTSYVRNATKSKGIENDTWWRAGDSASIGDTLIANMNRENGLRSQSWSDFQVIHMMDYIAAVIELSTRNSKMQAYTKVPDYVELMGKTGAMINLSLIPTRNYLGFLDYDSTEGMDYRKSLELRNKYHETVGTICIGVDNRQIKQLLEDMTIDYVIPYHKSGMASHIRKAMHIPTWTQYENYQNEKKLSDVEARKNADKYGVKLLDKSDANYQKHTSFSEWFDLKEAQQIAKMENAHPSDPVKQKKYGVMYGGYMAMQNAANNYLKLCAERGLAPVFSHKKADFTGEDNYWKVLIDRKMVDNITGEVIEQKAIQPIFDEAEVLRILNDELERYPKVKADQEYAIRRVTEKFLSGDIKEGMPSDAIAKAMQKPVDNISKTNIVEAGKEMEVKLSDRDSDGNKFSIRESDNTDSEAVKLREQLMAKREELRQNDVKQDELEGSKEYEELISMITESGASPEVLAKYKEWDNKTGFSEIVNRGKQLAAEAREIYARYEKALLDEEKAQEVKSIEKSGLSETDYHRKQAVKEFGYTPYFYDAGYILPNGKMLNFSGEKGVHYGSRVQDHRAIGTIFAGNVSGSEAMVKFMQEGNIRIMPEGPSVDISSVEQPTKEQYAVIKKFVREYSKEEYFSIDFTDAKGHTVGSYSYEGKVNADRVVNDIKYFFENGETRPDSGIGQFLYSMRDSDGNELSKQQQEYFKDSKVRDEEGNLLVVYHGTTEDFTVFDRTKSRANMDIQGSFFSPWKEDAQGYGGNIGAYYLNIKNPASESMGYKALNKFKGQNGAGIKAREYLQRLGYDGVNNGGEEYIAFDSNQVKLVDNKTPTTDPDIRYSDRDYSYIGESALFQDRPGAQNPKAEKAVRKGEGKLLRAVAKYFGVSSTQANESLAPIIRELSISLMEGKSDVTELQQKLYETAFEKGSATEDLREEYANIRKYIQGTSIYVDEGTRSDFGGDYESFRKSNAGKLRLTSDPKAVSVDDFYSELANMSLGFDSDNTDPKAQLEAIADFMDSTGRNTYGLDRYGTKEEYISSVSQNGEVMDSLMAYYTAISEASQSGEDFIFKMDEGMSNRSLLANAFEGIAQNGTEARYITEYRKKIDLIDSEEAHLREVNEKIKELSFAKGPKDSKQLRELHDDATRTANRISVYDKQLLRLEAAKPLQDVLAREKKAAYRRAEQKGKQALSKYREKAVATQKEIMTRYQESRKKAVEGREQTAMRNKVKGVVAELNHLLLNGTKDRHVMIGLQKAVAEALDAVNMDTIGADERVAKYDALIAKANDPDVIASLTATRDRIRRQGDNLSEKIAQLKAAYGDIKNSDDPLVANGYDEVIASKIDAVVSTVGNTPLRAMSTKQLEDVYDMYKMVLTRIRGANESFKSAKKEAISVLGNRVMMEVEHVGGKHPYRLKGSEKIEGFMWNNLKPVYAFEKIGSKTLTEVYNNVRAGEDTFAKDVTEAREFFVKENRKYHYDKWNMDKTFSFKSKTGQSFKLTIPQIMSLYAYSKRNQADKHLELGGFVFDSNIEVTQKKKGIPVKYTVNTATAHNISKETLGDIIGKLTAEQKAFVDEMQDFLSTTMGEKGNEVSLAMYGVKLFKEKHYFPLKSAKQFMFEQNETAGEVKLKNSGFSKETVVNASNPIILSNFMDVWANHVNDMSMYHSFVLPLEDFNRVFNYKTPNSESLDTESVKQFIQNAYGKEANAYIKQLLTDLNGGAVSDPRETTAKRLISNFKKAAVFSSASVVIQQPSAIGRALAIIDPKYFVGGKIGARGHSALWAEVKKYAPVAIIKEMGYFDTNMGRSTVDFITAKEYKGFAEKAKGIIADSGYRDEVLSKAPALADEITWCAIWNAVKRETKAKHKELTPGSEEFLKAAGARFTEVITKTQVYDSILSRSANMRSKSTFMSMWTSFMGEPTTSINMIEDAIRQGKRGNKKYAAKAIGAVFTSMVLNSLLVSLVYAARDDDDDETYLEKYLASLTSEVIEGINPLTYLPFFKDVWSSLQGFDIERADMSLITKLIESTQKAYKVYTEDTEDMTEDELLEHDKKVVEANWSIVDGISSLIGLPVKNLRRDINGAINLVHTVEKDLGGRKTTKGSLADKIEEAVRNSVPILGWGKGESRGDRLYDAIIAGDETYVNRIKDSIGDDQKYANMRFATLRDNDPRIKEAAQTAFGGDYAGAKKIAEAIIAEGNFSRNEVFGVISTELTKLKNAGKENSYEEKDKLLFGANDFFNAAKNNNVKDANAIRDELIAKKQDEGYLKWEAINSVESSFASEVKKSYIDGDITAQKAKDILMKYGGKESVSEAETEIKKWNFELKQGYTWSARARGYRLGDISKQELISAVMDIEGDDEEGAELYIRFLDLAKNNEDIEITSYDASSYFKYAEPAGIEVATYLDYKDEASKCKGEKDEYGNTIRNTKKAQILLVIDALPITNEQKDALYFANGWAQSTLKDAPWH